MVGVAASADSKSIVILGHGLTIEEEAELNAGIFVSPTIPKLDLNATVDGCRHFSDYAAALQGSEMATFALRVEQDDGGKFLATKAWNALWLFHLLSVACRAPCFSLYSVCDGHGGGLTKPKLEEGYRTAGSILIGLIAKCVELGRVPSPSELDRLAVSANMG